MPASPTFPALLAEAATCLRFYTRLPVPAFAAERRHPPTPFGRCLRWAPLAGAGVGLFGAAALAAAAACGLPPSLGAALALLTTLAVSGALHEDGLADCADGFGGGATRERKLDIMRDSRLGTYGVAAVVASLGLRAAAVAALAEHGGAGAAAAALTAAAASSRGFGLMPLALLAPVRADGLGRGAGPLPPTVFPTASAGAALLGLALPIWAGVPLPRAALALGLAALAAGAVTLFARRQIGGVTGDVAGACQQACEVAALVGLLVAPDAV